MALTTSYIQPRVQIIHADNAEALLTIGPIEKGFGTSFANILRRVILRYTPGVGIIGIKIKGIERLHPYANIPGVKEGVNEIISNLKNIYLKTGNKKTIQMHIEKKGPYIVTAKDILHDNDVTILNTDQYICTLANEGQLRMVIYGNMGFGFVPSTYHNYRKDIVYCDTIYSPIKHISYSTRSYATYEEVLINIQTNGTCSPVFALKNAFAFLKDKTNIVI